MAANGTMRITKGEESALASMPTSAESLLRAASAIRPLLPVEDFYGEVTIVYEAGRPLRLYCAKWNMVKL